MHESESDSDVDWSVIDSQEEEGLDTRSTAFDVESRMSRSLDFGLRDTDSQHFGAVSPSHHSLECSDVGTSVFHQPASACNGVSPPGTCNNEIDVDRIAAPELNQGDKITTKLKSVWHNMRFELKGKLKTSLKLESPIWLLGKCYHLPKTEGDQQDGHKVNRLSYLTPLETFKRDFTSRLWFTYRKNFPVLRGTQLTSDVGWGCMIRTGQMLLAQGLLMHFLGRDWHWYQQQKKHEVGYHPQIIRFFGDQLIECCPFSIHRLVRIGLDLGKQPGEWYGPSSMAHIFRDAMEMASESNPMLGQICLYVAQDCTVYKQDVIDLCTRMSHPSRPSSAHGGSVSSDDLGGTSEHWKAVIILIPVRLGGTELNPIYIACLQCMLAYDMCLGIMGGKPKHSLYFIGSQDNDLVYLDPHFCQDTVDMRQATFPIHSFHCTSPHKMSAAKLDPSCTIGFYCKTQADFEKLIRDAEMMTSPPKEKSQYPMFAFAEGRNVDLGLNDQATNGADRRLRICYTDRNGPLKMKESDDYILL
ncbi:Cysteine protease ATG4D [Lamellibrachia satsuma]|nr:Cysteine protease ATG4D [Lamellibrachia satsuma]